MNFSFFIFIIFLILKFSVVTSTSFQPISFSSSIQDANLFTKTYEYSLASFQFDRELYVFDSMTCPLLPDPLPPWTNCTCSFLRGDQCGIAVPATSAWDPAASVPGGCQAYCQDLAVTGSLCEPSLQWTQLSADGQIEATDPFATETYFRYHNPDPTTGFRIDVEALGSSNFLIFASPSIAMPDRWNAIVQYVYWFGMPRVTVCPGFETEFTPGTWFISVVPLTILTDLSTAVPDLTNQARVVLRLHPGIQASATFPDPDGCDPLGFDVAPILPGVNVNCIRPGDTQYRPFSASQTQVYYTMILECGLYKALVHSPDGDRDVYQTYHKPTLADNWDLYEQARYIYGDDEFTFNPCIDGRTPPFPIYWLVDYFGSYYFTVSNRAKPLSKRIVDFSASALAQSELIHVSRMYCDDQPFDKDILSCDIWETECEYTWPLYPFLHPAPSFPMPAALNNQRSASILSTFQLGNGSDPRWPADPKLYRHVVALSEYAAPLRDILPQCYIWFSGGGMGDADGNAVDGKYFLTEDTQVNMKVCNLTQFYQLVSLAEDMYHALANLLPESSRYINEYIFALDTIYDSPVWQGCSAEAKSLISYTTFNYTQDAPMPCMYSAFDEQFAVDPCCSLQGQRMGVCPMIPTEYSIQVPSSIDSAAFYASSCSNCTTFLLNSLIDVDSSSCLLGIEKVTGDTTDERIQILKLVDRCMHDTMGPAFRDGIKCDALIDPFCQEVTVPRFHASRCSTDTDCPGSVCDKFSLSCLVPVRLQEQALIRCIVGNLSSSSLTYLERLLSPVSAPLPPSPFSTYASELLWNRSRTTTCTGAYSIPLQFRDHWLLENMDAQCASVLNLDTTCNNILRTDNARAVPGENCRDQCGDDGQFRYYPASDQSFCDARPVCSRGAQYTTEDDCYSTQTTHFCGFCADPSDELACIEVPQLTDVNSCQSTQVCLLPDFTIRTDLTPAQCAQFTACSGKCSEYQCAGPDPQCASLSLDQCIECAFSNGTSPICPDISLSSVCYPVFERDCLTEQECISQGGSCSDQEVASPDEYLYPDGAPGYCAIHFNAIPVSLRQYFACDDERFTDYINFGCNDLYQPNPLNCTGNWHWKATTRDECEAVSMCLVDIYNHRLFLDRRGTLQSEENCTQTGTWQTAFTWTPAYWTTGRMVDLEWRPLSFASPYVFEDALSFDQLLSDILLSADLHDSSALQANGLCRYNQEPDLLDKIICDCDDQSTESFSQCSESDYSTDLVGTVFHCLDDLILTNGSAFYSPPVYLYFDVTAIRPEDVCSLVYLSLLPANDYYRNVVPKVPLSFAFRPALSTKEVVLNQHNTVVGQLLSDGVRIAADQNVFPTNFTLCLSIKEYQPDDVYSTLGFATLRHGKVITLALDDVYLASINISAQDTLFLCVDFNSQGPNVLGNDLEFFPVGLIPNWSSKSSEFSSSTLALLYTLAALYVILFIPLFILVLIKEWVGPLIWIAMLGIFLITTIRFSYFFMAAAGVFAQGKNINLEFVFIIFPIYMLFSVFALQSAAWLLTIFKMLTLRKLLTYFFACNVLFYITFVVWTILFATLPPTVTEKCSGLLDSSIDSSTQDAINLAFTIYLVVLSCLLAFSFFFAPLKLFSSVRETDESGALLSQICFRIGPPMFGLIVIAVLILVLAIRATESQYFVFFMLLAGEFFPILLLEYRLFAAAPATPSANSSRSKRSIVSRLSIGRSGSGSRTSSRPSLT